MKVSSEFSKYANKYDEYSIIQDKVAKKLLSMVKDEPKYILDLGCGSGRLSKDITWKYEKLLGIDFALGMIDIHPRAKNIECMYGDFNDSALFRDKLSKYNFDYILSASALQWSDDIEKTFKDIKSLNSSVALAIFTSNTFSTLYKTASLKPLLPTKEKVYELQKRYFNINFEIVEYKLKFNNVRDMFKYIKRSGVSGSRNILTFKQMKKLMDEYPLDYLEFEVVFVSS